MAFSEQDYKQELDGLRFEIDRTRRNVIADSKRFYNGPREHALIHWLSLAGDLAQGCTLAAEARLSGSLALLTRGIVECLIWEGWVIASDENAAEFANVGKNEMLRVVKANLGARTGKVTDRETGKVVTEEFLKSPDMKNVQKPLPIEQAAEQLGLRRLYNQIYRPLSVSAHGKDYGISIYESSDEEAHGLVSLANALMAGVNLVSSNWFSKRTHTQTSELYDEIGMDAGRDKP